MERHEPELIDILIAERALDRARLTWSAREARRASGVAWSGMAAAACAPRTDDALLDEAQAKLLARRVWRESAQGRFLRAITQAQTAARAAHASGERAREAAARGFQDEVETCETLSRDLRRHALALIAGVRAARRAVRND